MPGKRRAGRMKSKAAGFGKHEGRYKVDKKDCCDAVCRQQGGALCYELFPYSPQPLGCSP